MLDLLPTSKPMIDAGKVRVLGVSTMRRSSDMPDLPTAHESGVRDYESAVWMGLLAPAGTPPAIVARLAAELRKAVLHPEAVKRFEGLGIDPVGSTPEQYAAQLAADIATFSQAVKLSGAKVE
jgi:tripartite-type tricarboxylate transporter receptor subunit TctC